MRANGPSLNDKQLRYVHRAAASVAPEFRDYFLSVVSDHLTGVCGDAAVAQAVDIGLRYAGHRANGDHRYFG
jgi:hypothetical protein